MIRPRDQSPYHDYRQLFQDLRDGLVTELEYSVMLEEDLTEVNRRKAWVRHLRAEAIIAHEDNKDNKVIRRIADDLEAKGDTIAASTVRLGGMSGIKIKDEPSGAY